MNEPPERLSLRRLLRSPAYRLGAGRKGRRLLDAGILLLVFGAVWIGSAIPLMTAAHPDIGEGLLIGLGRLLGIPLLLLVVAIRGALAFAPERRWGTVDQFVLLPLPEREKLLARALAAAMPILPALAVVLFSDVAMGALSPNAGRSSFMVFGAVMAVTMASTVLLVFSLGLWSSLRTGTPGRAVALAVLLGTTAVGLEMLALSIAVTILSAVGLVGDAEVPLAIVAILAHVAAATIMAMLVLRSCIRHMNARLLREG